MRASGNFLLVNWYKVSKECVPYVKNIERKISFKGSVWAIAHKAHALIRHSKELLSLKVCKSFVLQKYKKKLIFPKQIMLRAIHLIFTM